MQTALNPRPVLDAPEPRESARTRELPCRVQDPDLWFAETPADIEAAKQLCGGCPIRAACLAGALDRQEPWGVWGGELFERGAIIPRKRPRGRPRKHPLAAVNAKGPGLAAQKNAKEEAA